MKNKRFETVIIAVTLIFATFTLGFFIGRNSVEGSFTVETQNIIVEANDTNSDEDIAVININTADLETLVELPGIGEAIAQRIIDYREANGDFKTIEDIKNVSGIGESVYKNIQLLITVSD
ncbi:MAG: ComEA family DNA-binding protein [Ruminococcaceae bacterium]|nr:ComEA family DNA-binding protein [Oscillospiraceae bacterium]